jgi:hypothetical protein
MTQSSIKIFSTANLMKAKSNSKSSYGLERSIERTFNSIYRLSLHEFRFRLHHHSPTSAQLHVSFPLGAMLESSSPHSQPILPLHLLLSQTNLHPPHLLQTSCRQFIPLAFQPSINHAIPCVVPSLTSTSILVIDANCLGVR